MALGGKGRADANTSRSASPKPRAEGAANEAVLKLLAKALGISRSEVTIIAGATSRNKRLAIPFDVQEARGRLGT